ncbi:MAG: AraC family transcriptional regulator [Kofleriaceae bacterium]
MAPPPLVELLKAHTPVAGSNATHWPGLTLLRVTQPMARTAVVYEPCVCFVARGDKQVHVGTETYRYDPMHYLVVSLPLPLEAEIVHATPDEPLLALVLRVDVAQVGQLLLEMEEANAVVGGQAQAGLYVSPIHEELADAITRMVAVSTDPTRARVLGPGVMREVVFHVLGGEQGERLRQVVRSAGGGRGVERAVRHLQENFAEPTDVDQLARMVGMSASTLHRSFKEVTALTPIQYLKTIRLHRARALMLSAGLTAGEAAYRVGYQSQSQFSREFKRLFGATPRQALQRMSDGLVGDARVGAAARGASAG